MKDKRMRAFNPYIFVVFFTFLFGTFSCQMISPVLAGDASLVEATYYRLDSENPGKYRKLVTWQINNESEWVGFTTKVRGSSHAEVPIDNPMNGKSDVIHLSRKASDMITREDFYITKNGISYIANKAVDSYSYVPKGFRAFLDKELREHNDYDKEKQANINTPGLVVMYNASKELNNPTWVLSTKDELAPYLNFIKNHRPMESSAIEMQVQNGGYDLLSSYIIYMNIPFAPARFITVQYDEAVRMTKVTPVQATYVDDFSYYTHYMKVAQDVLISEQTEEMQRLVRPNDEKNF
jgi:hypothetical protein